MKIGFLYYDFYPVKGGASVHGYHLAKELDRAGFKLYKINGEEDPYTKKFKNRFTGFVKMLKQCDVIYLRVDYFIKLRNLSLLFALMAGKKVVVELNSPSDELHLYGKNQAYISRVDKLMSFFLNRVDAVIVVSHAIEKYCIEALKIDPSKVYVIENGGQVFDDQANAATPAVREKMDGLRSKYRKIAVWAGSPNKMQDMGILKYLSDGKATDTAIVAILKSEKKNSIRLKSDNIFIFRKIGRDDVSYIIRSSDIGLAFYEEYNWSRWGFYNSSLKIFEFLNNGLLTISNKQGTEVQRKYPNFRVAESNKEILELLRSDLPIQKKDYIIRTWETVGKEVSDVLRKVYNA